MGRSWFLPFLLLHLLLPLQGSSLSDPIHHRIDGGIRHGGDGRRVVMDVEGGPASVVWVVQLSDLHFSVHHPDRALDFKRLIGPALAMIKPSLVLITGDLTDGKSRDLLVMKQNEDEWIEYQNVMADVVKQSGLDANIFYDLRGNHDQFGVPMKGGSYDFYGKYSNNAHVGRSTNVYSVTLKNNGWKHLFVGFDSAMDVGLRGPTNLFGHLSEQILNDLDVELSQWDSESSQSHVTKLSFGHFPLSFSTISEKGRSLKDIFLKHSISAYVCGHLHSKFGKNLKRNHRAGYHFPVLGDFYQINLHQGFVHNIGKKDCSKTSNSTNEFWEWEMGDWRRRRAMRILAIDSGHVSFLDTDFSFGIKKTIILQTFPLDSRFMQKASSNLDYICQSLETSSYNSVRALVFSEIEIDKVYVKVYDSRPGYLNLVMEAAMTKHAQNESRGDLYETSWNWKAFVDPSPDRYWLQIEAVDIMGDSSFSQLKPFSINGLVAKVNWTWREFLVMGIHWGSVFHPILYTSFLVLFCLIIIPRAFLIIVRNYTYGSGNLRHYNTSIIYNLVLRSCQILLEFAKSTIVWLSVLLYTIYLTFFPWFSGHVFTQADQVGYMTLTGWSIKSPYYSGVQSHLGVPDIMVVILPHIYFVFFPAVFVMFALLAERASYRIYYISLSKKKQDDALGKGKQRRNHTGGFRTLFASGSCWLRKILLLICLAILWKHWKQCRALVKAYEMNPFIHAPVYCFMLPLLLVYTFYSTGAPWKAD